MRSESKNLIERNGVWYFQKTYRGKRYFLSTGQTSLPLARKKRDYFDAKIREGDVTALTAARMKRSVGTLGEVVREYQRVCQDRGEPRPNTITNNVNALGRLVRDATGKQLNGQPASILDKNLLTTYRRAKLDERGDTPSTRRSILSTVTQARSLFTRELVQDYDLELPDLTEFREYSLGRYPSKDVPLPPLALRLTLMRAARRLWLDRDPRYLVYVMARYLGMRSEEMVCARWSWIEEHMGARRMALRDRPEEDYKIKGVRAGNVPIHPAVLRRLMAYRKPYSEYILPGDTRNKRHTLVGRSFAEFMTDQGWDQIETTKRAHELRRLYGSAVFVKYGKEECWMWMRHCSFSTTEKNYLNINLDLRPRELVGI